MNSSGVTLDSCCSPVPHRNSHALGGGPGQKGLSVPDAKGPHPALPWYPRRTWEVPHEGRKGPPILLLPLWPEAFLCLTSKAMMGRLALEWRVGPGLLPGDIEKSKQITEAVAGLVRSQGGLPLSSISYYPSFAQFLLQCAIVLWLCFVLW